MADDKDLTPEEKAKKAREEAIEEQDNPPEPYPSQEQLNKIQQGEPLDEDEDEGDEPATPRRPGRPPNQPQPAPAPSKSVEAEKPAGGYQTR